MPRTLALLFLALALALGAWFVLLDDSSPRTSDALAGDGRSVALAPTPGASSELARPDSLEGGPSARTAAERTNAATGPRVLPSVAEAQRAPQRATGPFHGRLLDPAGGPVADAAIELRPWADRDRIQQRIGGLGEKAWPIGKSGKDGRFTIPYDARIGKAIGVIAKARGFQDAPFQAVLEDANDPKLGDLIVARAAILQGFVHDERRAPIAGATLRLGSTGEDMQAAALRAFGMGGFLTLAETDAQGRFELAHLQPGDVTLIVEHPEHHAARWSGTTPTAGGVVSDLDIELVRAGSIRGVVNGFPDGRRGVYVAARRIDEGKGGESVSGREAVLQNLMAPTGSETAEVVDGGRFELHGLALTGRYELTVSERQDFVQVVPLSETVNAESGASGVVLDFDSGAKVRMRLVDSQSKDPIRVAEITGNWGRERARIHYSKDAFTRPSSFEGGVIELFELRPPKDPSTLTLKVTAPGYIETRLDPFDVNQRSFVELSDVELVAAPKLKFKVVDATTGKPVVRAQVSVKEPNDVEDFGQLWQRGMDAKGRSVKDRTGKDGRVELDSIDAPLATLTVYADGYPTYRDFAFVPRLTEREHRIAMLRGGDLEVYVVDPTGQPVERARVLLRNAGSEDKPREDDTNGAGLARWKDEPPGRYQVRTFRRGDDPASKAGATVVWTDVEVVSGRGSELVLAVRAASTLKGRVTLSGAPLPGAQLSLLPRGSDVTTREAARMGRGGRGGPGGGGGQRGARGSDSTDTEGRFAMVEVLPAAYDLIVNHTSLATAAVWPVDVGEGESEVEVSLVVATLEGVITGSDGKALVGAKVSAGPVTTAGAGQSNPARAFQSLMRDGSRDIATDEQGRFRLLGLTTTEQIEVTARAEGFVTGRSAPMQLGAGEVRTNVDVRLRSAGKVRVQFVSATPNPAGAVISGRYLGQGQVDEVVEISRGARTTIDGLTPGAWEFSARNFRGPGGGGNANNAIDVPKRVEVVAGEEAQLEFQR